METFADLFPVLLFVALPVVALLGAYIGLVLWARTRRPDFAGAAILACVGSLAIGAAFAVWAGATPSGQMPSFFLAPWVGGFAGLCGLVFTWGLTCLLPSIRRRKEDVLLNVFMAFGGAAMLYAVAIIYTQSAERSNRIDCNNNLKQIGLALHIYSSDHSNEFPRSFADLAPTYLNEPMLFVCPSARSKPGPMSAVHEWCDYIYVSGLCEADPSDVVQAIEKPTNHGGEGGNVLFVGGYVKWCNQADLMELFRQLGASGIAYGSRLDRGPPIGPLAVAPSLTNRVTVIFPRHAAR